MSEQGTIYAIEWTMENFDVSSWHDRWHERIAISGPEDLEDADRYDSVQRLVAERYRDGSARVEIVGSVEEPGVPDFVREAAARHSPRIQAGYDEGVIVSGPQWGRIRFVEVPG